MPIKDYLYGRKLLLPLNLKIEKIDNDDWNLLDQ